MEGECIFRPSRSEEEATTNEIESESRRRASVSSLADASFESLRGLQPDVRCQRAVHDCCDSTAVDHGRPCCLRVVNAEQAHQRRAEKDEDEKADDNNCAVIVLESGITSPSCPLPFLASIKHGSESSHPRQNGRECANAERGDADEKMIIDWNRAKDKHFLSTDDA